MMMLEFIFRDVRWLVRAQVDVDVDEEGDVRQTLRHVEIEDAKWCDDDRDVSPDFIQVITEDTRWRTTLLAQVPRLNIQGGHPCSPTRSSKQSTPDS